VFLMIRRILARFRFMSRLDRIDTSIVRIKDSEDTVHCTHPLLLAAQAFWVGH
jgi:hypothetical protein